MDRNIIANLDNSYNLQKINDEFSFLAKDNHIKELDKISIDNSKYSQDLIGRFSGKDELDFSQGVLMFYNKYKKIATAMFCLLISFSNAAVNIHTNGIVNLYNFGDLTTSGNWSNEGNFNSGSGSTIEFIGSTDISLSNNLEFSNLLINKSSGNIITNSKMVNLSSSATLQ